MRDYNAPEEACYLIELGMTDADYVPHMLGRLGSCRPRSADEDETVIFVYCTDIADLVSELTMLLTFNQIEYAQAYRLVPRDLSLNYALWRWLE